MSASFFTIIFHQCSAYIIFPKKKNQLNNIKHFPTKNTVVIWNCGQIVWCSKDFTPMERNMRERSSNINDALALALSVIVSYQFQCCILRSLQVAMSSLSVYIERRPTCLNVVPSSFWHYHHSDLF